MKKFYGQNICLDKQTNGRTEGQIDMEIKLKNKLIVLAENNDFEPPKNKMKKIGRLPKPAKKIREMFS